MTDSAREQRIQRLGYQYADQPKEEVDACNLCGGTRWTRLTKRDRYGYDAAAAACVRCGLVVLKSRMTAQAYAHFYGSVYRPLVSAYHGRRIDAESLPKEQREYAALVHEYFRKYLPPTGTLLDIGGSTGVVSHYLADHAGLRPTIIDPAPLELDEARKLGLETVAGFVESWEPEGRIFDVAAMFQTVDHLLDIASTLAKVKEVLSPAGVFYVDIVDFRAAYLRAWSIESAVKIDHPYYLTEQTFEAFLARAGFRTLETIYYPDRLHIGFVTCHGKPDPGALPPANFARDQLREIRFVQNAPSSAVQ